MKDNKPSPYVEYVHMLPFASTYLCVCRSPSRFLQASENNKFKSNKFKGDRKKYD